ncbi:MAG: hypothetical protein HS101_12885 [Planctomycetia bacterium]|nr:hypothetical protein [Planctomycetia bacterium]MCC7313213.1 hypothetical protein [Planctomycetota bacterium]OQZ02351.1 MAG: hypothetical protein B6D36_13420 [Planctomycetes bacterium UTPLA1]
MIDEPAQIEQPGPSRRFSAKRRALIAAGLVVGLPLLVTFFLAVRTPGWYRPPVIAPEERQLVRNNLVAAEQAFTESVRGPGDPFTYHLHAGDVNRWISMRREIYPLIDQLLPPMLDDPFVAFEDGRITIAGRYRLAGMRVVVSLEILARYASGDIILTAGKIRCGSLPLPTRFVEETISRPIRRGPDKVWPGSPAMSGDLLTGFHLDGSAWWKNGGIDYRVTGLRVEKGILSLDIKPLGRHVPRKGPAPNHPSL